MENQQGKGFVKQIVGKWKRCWVMRISPRIGTGFLSGTLGRWGRTADLFTELFGVKSRTRIEVLEVRGCCSQAALGRTKQRFSMELWPVPGVPCSTTSTLHTKPCPGLGLLLEGAGVQTEHFNFKIYKLLLMEMMDHSIRVGITQSSRCFSLF